MREDICTIPVSEGFEPLDGCPLCRMRAIAQKRVIDFIMGAAMMEPDIRIKTNEMGFCQKHYSIMLSRKRMLGMGLMMESHLPEVEKRLKAKSLLGDPSASSVKALSELENSCYVCSRIEKNLNAMISTAVYLYENEEEFRDKFREQPYFCIPHYDMLISYASKKMNKKLFKDFFHEARGINTAYMDTLKGDVSWFCKKFDYNYEEEPWYNSKDSVQRSIKFLCGSLEFEE